MIEEKLLSFALLGAGWVLWVLVALSIACLAISVERVVYGALQRSQSARLDEHLRTFFEGGDLENLRGALGQIRGIEARILLAGVEATGDGGTQAGEEAIAGTLLLERSRLERGLIVLGTTGSNAPFIGLFGTVLGIIRAFHDLSLDSMDTANAVMAGISEALVATAVGLLVAIPAVVLYNTFQRRNKDLLDRIQSLSHLVLSRAHALGSGS